MILLNGEKNIVLQGDNILKEVVKLREKIIKVFLKDFKKNLIEQKKIIKMLIY